MNIMFCIGLCVVCLGFVLMHLKTFIDIAKISEMLHKSNEDKKEPKSEVSNEEIHSAIMDLSEKLASAKSRIECISYTQDKTKEAISTANTEIRGAIETLDSTIAGMHYTVDRNAEEVKKCMTGIDENTRKIFGDLIVAVEKNDVAKLADVVRAAKAFVENFDAVQKATKSPFAVTVDNGSYSAPCKPVKHKKCKGWYSDFIKVSEEGTFDYEKKKIDDLYVKMVEKEFS